MDPQLFQRFSALAHEKAGIAIRPGKDALVSARVAKRLRALSLTGPGAYLDYLEQDRSGDELSCFLDVISTHFTSFFREPDHFELLREELERLVARGQRRIRLWSAAASTGEEPYTMAMVALSVPGIDRCDLRILATDIALDTLRQAAQGRYGASRLEPVPAALRERWFTRVPGNRDLDGDAVFDLRPEVRALVTFRRLNLAQPPFPMRGPLDVVFCRNVLIYFDHPTRQRLLSAVEPLVAPGGLLCIGHTETLNGIRGGFKLVRPSVFRVRVGERAA
ncbi:MAG TPA: CheR family methyltransferase [Anaeromyxobacteraceae bacterium]|nr:CheR family methyltransferase [Anaeromyxobacteraceae bacterium]